jgi:hypothetical protein
MYHVHQPWTDIEAMPVYDRKAYMKRLDAQFSRERAEMAALTAGGPRRR